MTSHQETGRIVMQLTSNSNEPITLTDARYRHLEYLEHGPHIFTTDSDENEKILHSFSINKEDLDLLYRNAEDGLRLHFCRESSGKLNIIAVPIAKGGELNLNLDLEREIQPIVNTLEPCPSLCSPLFSENSLNAWSEEGQFSWLDPNDEQEGKTWFTKGDAGQKIFIDRPDTAPTI